MSESSGRIVRMMPDAIFDDPRLAAIYDDIDGDRSDLNHYEPSSMSSALAASSTSVAAPERSLVGLRRAG